MRTILALVLAIASVAQAASAQTKQISPPAPIIGPAPPPALPSVESLAPASGAEAPDAIWYEVRVWGALQYTWKIERGGEGRFRRLDHPELVFRVEPEAFDRIHAMLNYEAVNARPEKNCTPGPTDGPYGSVHWRIAGADRVVEWSSGRTCSNTAFLYESIDNADLAVGLLAGLTREQR